MYVPGLPGTLGWDGQWDWGHLEWDTRDMSGMSLGLWEGMDSGIGVIHSGSLRTCPGCPWASWDSRMGWTLGLEPSTVGRLRHVQDVPWLPGTLGWDGQWDLQPSRVGRLGCVRDVPGTLGWDGQWDLEWDIWDMSGTSLGFPRLWMGWTVRLEPSRVGHSRHVQDVPGLSGTLGWDGQWDCSHLEWDTWDVPGTLGWDGQWDLEWDIWDMSGTSLGFPRLWMGWTVRLEPSRVGHSRHVQDVPGLSGTLGWDGQWDCSHLEWDTWDVSGTLGCGIAAI